MNPFKFYYLYLLFLLISVSCNVKNSNKNDKNALQSEINNSNEIKEKPCHEIVEMILINSNKFKELTKGLNERIIANGGIGYILMAENNSDFNYTSLKDNYTNYEYSLRENYPDRAIPIAKFIFNSKNLELYEENMSEGTLIKIEIDKKLLDTYNNHCK